MRKILRLFICITLLLCIFTSCTDEPLTDIKTGSVSLALTGADDAAYYKIHAETSLLKDEIGNSIEKIFTGKKIVLDLIPGEWKVSVEAYDDEDRLIAKADPISVGVKCNAVQSTDYELVKIKSEIPSANTVPCTLTVTLSTNDDTEIYYSVDGKSFSLYPESGIDFEKIIKTESSITIYTYAVKEGFEKSDTVSCEYQINHKMVPSYSWEKTGDGYKCNAAMVCEYHPEYVTVKEESVASAVIKSDSTCAEEGSADYTAVFTKEEFENQTSEFAVPKSNHDFSQEKAEDVYMKDAGSCTVNTVYYKSCSVCGAASSSDTFEIEALGHDFSGEVKSEEYLKTAATCTTRAVYYKSCIKCGEKSASEEFSGSFLPHDFIEIISENNVKLAPTCKKNGTYYLSCSSCGRKSSDTFIGEDTALGGEHVFVDYRCAR